jgi:tyrosyl-tRNA synthetase
MLTFIPLEEIDKMDAWEGAQLNEAKDILAYELTALVHGKEEAEKARTASKALFGGGNDDSNMPTVKLSADALTDGSIAIMDLLVAAEVTPSKSEARRLITQGGLVIDDEKITDLGYIVTLEALKAGIKVRKGKKSFYKILVD